MRQVLGPGVVVEGLGDNIARRPIALEFENVDSAVFLGAEKGPGRDDPRSQVTTGSPVTTLLASAKSLTNDHS